MRILGEEVNWLVDLKDFMCRSREVTQKNNLLSEKDTLIGEKDHRLAELVRQQEVRQLYCLYISYVYIL